MYEKLNFSARKNRRLLALQHSTIALLQVESNGTRQHYSFNQTSLQRAIRQVRLPIFQKSSPLTLIQRAMQFVEDQAMVMKPDEYLGSLRKAPSAGMYTHVVLLRSISLLRIDWDFQPLCPPKRLMKEIQLQQPDITDSLEVYKWAVMRLARDRYERERA